jgi:hypothetical protein
VPIAIVNIVDPDRIWFKSHRGREATEAGRDLGYASRPYFRTTHIIEDSAKDAHPLSNLLSTEFGLRFYTGVPLTTTDGFNLGTPCVIDRKPRSLNELELENLRSSITVYGSA